GRPPTRRPACRPLLGPAARGAGGQSPQPAASQALVAARRPGRRAGAARARGRRQPEPRADRGDQRVARQRVGGGLPQPCGRDPARGRAGGGRRRPRALRTGPGGAPGDHRGPLLPRARRLLAGVRRHHRQPSQRHRRARAPPGDVPDAPAHRSARAAPAPL
ncbi:MAG: hypothetical protein AVDCRST_MAG06-720, partial [uncultured Nocardioides sp.]